MKPILMNKKNKCFTFVFLNCQQERN